MSAADRAQRAYLEGLPRCTQESIAHSIRQQLELQTLQRAKHPQQQQQQQTKQVQQ
jgi:hypothetical protein